MSKIIHKASAPLTFDVPESLITRIENCRKTHGLASASEVVRSAISDFKFDRCNPVHEDHRQVSVRLSTNQRAALKRWSRQKKTSIGELLRLAIEAMPERPQR